MSLREAIRRARGGDAPVRMARNGAQPGTPHDEVKGMTAESKRDELGASLARISAGIDALIRERDRMREALQSVLTCQAACRQCNVIARAALATSE